MVSRNWCFTINNFTEADENWVREVACDYIVAGKEHTSGEGTPHIQGYVEFSGCMRLSTLHGRCPRAHFERRRGTAVQADAYCRKEDTAPYFRGVISQQGKRSDLADVADAVVEGVPLSVIARENPALYVQYGRGLNLLQAALVEPRNPDTPPQVVWLWGKAGTGKTRRATNCDDFFIKDNSQWWDGYHGQKRVIFDDIDIRQWQFRELLQILDRNRHTVYIKGGSMQLNSPEIYITCEFPPGHYWWDNELAQISRRLALVEEVITADPLYVPEGPDVL